jgi:hypothetical protein
MQRAILACVITALVVGAGTATAAKLITSSDIKDGTIKTADIKNGTIKHQDIKESTITRDRLEKKVRRLLDEQGAAGPAGPAGPKGDKGDNGAAGAPGHDALTVVTAPGGGFSASPGGLTAFTPDGVVFGPFTNSASQFGGVRFEGADVVGQPLGDIAELTYSTGFNGTSNEPPYLRILTDVNGDGFNFNDCCEPGLDDHELLFSPADQPAPGSVGTAGRLIKYETTEGTWDYDTPLPPDDQPWDELVNAHADEPIFLIAITAGASAAGTTDAFLNSFSYELAGSAPVEVSFSN